jgi:putative SOS response-associated peptidase YedK
MCYNAVSATKAKIKYLKHRTDDPAYIAELEKQLELFLASHAPLYHVSGFAHPSLMVFTNLDPLCPQAFTWGLIPYWVKDKKAADIVQNQTLNAKAETIFEKPSFKIPAMQQRCVLYIDAFYEHHFANKMNIPFHISMKDGSPMAFAGLWDQWQNPASGEVFSTVTMVTCPANSLLRKIHKKEKDAEARMPVILLKKDQDTWLRDIKKTDDLVQLKSLLKPLDSSFLQYRTVQRLLGKSALGNCPEAEYAFAYENFSLEV